MKCWNKSHFVYNRSPKPLKLPNVFDVAVICDKSNSFQLLCTKISHQHTGRIFFYGWNQLRIPVESRIQLTWEINFPFENIPFFDIKSSNVSNRKIFKMQLGVDNKLFCYSIYSSFFSCELRTFLNTRRKSNSQPFHWSSVRKSSSRK